MDRRTSANKLRIGCGLVADKRIVASIGGSGKCK